MQLHAIILVGGKGKRMGSKTLPKVMLSLAGKPVIAHLTDLLTAEKINDIVVVIGFKGQKIIDYLGKKYKYAWQKKRLGTAHAALAARPFLIGKSGYTYIFYGDNPILRRDTLHRVAREMDKTNASVALTVAKASNKLSLGIAVIENGNLQKIVEQKVAPPGLAKKYKWRNTGSWLIENKFLWQALPKIKKNPDSGEYYLTDIVELANLAGKKVIAVPVTELAEAIGINTPEHLKQAEKWLLTKPKA